MIDLRTYGMGFTNWNGTAGTIGYVAKKIDFGEMDELIDEILGLGPLEELMRDPSVNEIMVNSPEKVYIEQKGKIVLTPLLFRDDDQIIQVIKRIVAPIGRRIDESVPLVDARLKDGSRVNAIIPPLAVSGPTHLVDEAISFRDDLTKIHGVHAFKMGYELLHNRSNSQATNFPSGQFLFDTMTAGLQPNGQPLPNTGNTFAGFLVGAVRQATFDSELTTWLPRSSIAVR